MEDSDSPRIKRVEEAETEEKRPPSRMKHEFLVERGTQTGTQYRPSVRSVYRGQGHDQRRRLSRILLILCVLGLASSTLYLTYFAYNSQQSISKLNDEKNRLSSDNAKLRATYDKAASLAKWLSASYILCENSYLPQKTRITVTFVDFEKDTSYNINRTDWLNYKITITYLIKDKVSGTNVLSETSWNLTSSNYKMSVDPSSSVGEGKYTFTVNARMGDSLAGSTSKDFSILRDTTPPAIRWQDNGAFSRDKMTVGAIVTDDESGVLSGSVKVNWYVYNKTMTTPILGGAPMTKRPNGEYVFNFADANLRGVDLRRDHVTLIYWIEASNNEQLTGYSEPVIQTL